MNLGRLWQQQGKEEARVFTSPMVGAKRVFALLARRRPHAHAVADCPYQGDVIRVAGATGSYFAT